MANHYDELLKLCGFEEEDINKDGVRFGKVLEKLGLSPADTKIAEEWVTRNHDTKLTGVRKLLKCWLLELMDSILAKDEGKRLIYFGFPPLMGLPTAIATASKGKVYCACPDFVLINTLGNIFNKLSPVLEAGEQNGLPPGHGFCSLLQAMTGSLTLGIFPPPDLLLATGYYCDMGSKVHEMLQRRYGYPVAYIDGCLDSPWGDYPNIRSERVHYLAAQMDKLVNTIKDVFGFELSEDYWVESMAYSRRFYSSLNQLSRLMLTDPVPISAVELELAMGLIIACTGRGIAEAPDAVETLCQELKQRVDEGFGIVEKGAPRVLIMLPPPSDPSIVHMIESTGLAIPAMQGTIPRIKRPDEISQYTSFFEKQAETILLDGLFHSQFAVAKRAEEIVKVLNMDGVIWDYQFGCRPQALGSHTVAKWIKESTGVPTLSLEMDHYDSRNFSAEALRTRIETFADVLRARKSVTVS